MKKLRLLAFLMTAALATTCFLGGTVAKYSTEKSADDSARVARWSFTVGPEETGKNIAKEDFVFDLFNTIKDSNGTDDESNVDVDGAGTETVIAPGTSGFFKLSLKNTSEVNAKYKINFSFTNSENIPIQFQVVTKGSSLGTEDSDWTDFTQIATLDVDGDGSGVAINMQATDEVTVYWRWKFDGNDTQDTALGTKDTNPILTVKASITAEQVD